MGFKASVLPEQHGANVRLDSATPVTSIVKKPDTWALCSLMDPLAPFAVPRALFGWAGFQFGFETA